MFHKPKRGYPDKELTRIIRHQFKSDQTDLSPNKGSFDSTVTMNYDTGGKGPKLFYRLNTGGIHRSLNHFDFYTGPESKKREMTCGTTSNEWTSGGLKSRHNLALTVPVCHPSLPSK